NAEVDHRVPLFRVWRDHRNEGWPKLLSYWGLPNLQVINRDVHVTKCAMKRSTEPRAIFHRNVFERNRANRSFRMSALAHISDSTRTLRQVWVGPNFEHLWPWT